MIMIIFKYEGFLPYVFGEPAFYWFAHERLRFV